MKLSPDYVCGFVDGEGCFTIVIAKHKQKKLGLDARLHFEIELRDDDEELLRNIQETLGCGRIYHLNYLKYGWHPHVELKVSSIREIKNVLIPFFLRHPLQGKKRRSFEYFVQAAEIFYIKRHLTQEGIEELRRIQKNMNRYHKNQGFATVRENRAPGGMRQTTSDGRSDLGTLPVKPAKSATPEAGVRNRKDRPFYGEVGDED